MTSEFVLAIIVATSGTAHGVVRLEGQIAAMTTDPVFAGGDYTMPPKQGIAVFGLVWAGWLYSQEWWRKELWRETNPPGTSFASTVESFRTRFAGDANDLRAEMACRETALQSLRVLRSCRDRS